MPWQSPISPGISWYESNVAERPEYPALSGSTETDVAIVGGGFTGLQAAYNLALKGVRVTLIDAYRFGDGASGRNGGQLGTGQRWSPEEMEDDARLRAVKGSCSIWRKMPKSICWHLRPRTRIDIEYVEGQLNVCHKPRQEKSIATASRSPHRVMDIPIKASWGGTRLSRGSVRSAICLVSAIPAPVISSR